MTCLIRIRPITDSIIRRAASAVVATLCAVTVWGSGGCRFAEPSKSTSALLNQDHGRNVAEIAELTEAANAGFQADDGDDQEEVQPVSFEQPMHDGVAGPVVGAATGPMVLGMEHAPPRRDQFERLTRVPMSLDAAVRIALENSVVLGDLGGRVLSMPETMSSTLDPAIVASNPMVGFDAALAAFDTQIEAGLTYNGNGNIVNSAFSGGQFGVFAQPETLAKLGVGKVLSNGTKVSLGGVAGYDEELAGGPFAAFGGEFRHPLMRGAGKRFNQIAGPLGGPGRYGGVLIAQTKHMQSQLAVEKAVGDLVRDVANTYWELQYAYLDVATKQTALATAHETWSRQRQRVAAASAPSDLAALAHQQVCMAEAALTSAIAGTRYGGAGVYGSELRLRTLLGIPSADGHLIVPDAVPLRAEFRFDWQDTQGVAHASRVELRRQREVIAQKELEIEAACNLQKTQLDVLGAFRKLGDDADSQSDLFGEALDGWQLGIEMRRSVSNRRENAAIRSARLQLSRETAVLQAQQNQVNAELQAAFTQLDRAWNMIASLTTAESAARMRLDAQNRRYQAGDDQVEDVLEAQVRLTEISTQLHRAVIDYNLAFVQLQHARGTLLPTVGVGLSTATPEECRFAQETPSVYMR
ncbi:TolC family protein [Neorhodopirellula lusitana]|uniref:TolC family protein n=1 Tax=Neorhodopirellula lusitana TaxID=445327 RepID=UPI00384AAE8A